MAEPRATNGRLRVAIVGAGPAGFFMADELLENATAEVTLFDRLPTPWGLVRAGVAPDHPNIKSVSRAFERVAQRDRIKFVGNVAVGTDVTHDELTEHFHAIVYAHGVGSDRRLGIPGETLTGSYSAAEFVAWYNGHPDAADLSFDLTGPRAVVVGNGNVALDVARMLLLTEEQLRVTDASDVAIDALSNSGITEVVLLGRRGPAQAAYTAPVLLEFGKLADVGVLIEPAGSLEDAETTRWLGSGNAERKAQENLDAIRDLLAKVPPSSTSRKLLTLRFLSSPTEILGASAVTGITVTGTELRASPTGDLDVVNTSVRETVECSAVFRAIGYWGNPIEGVPFDDETGTIPNDGGKVLSSPGGVPLRGVYAAGWIKRGASGVIGTNKKCASETAAQLFEDFHAGALREPVSNDDHLDALLNARRIVQIDDGAWKRIDEHERSKGLAEGRPRVKLVRHEELLQKGLETHRTRGGSR